MKEGDITVEEENRVITRRWWDMNESTKEWYKVAGQGLWAMKGRIPGLLHDDFDTVRSIKNFKLDFPDFVRWDVNNLLKMRLQG